MRYLSLVKAAENQGSPPKALMDAMGPLMAAGLADGSLIQTGGLARTASMVRVRAADGKVTVIDGPYTEAKEVVGGYAMVEYATREAAIEGTRKFMQLHIEHWPGWVGECELREIDFLAP
jgi:hypothetical protein